MIKKWLHQLFKTTTYKKNVIKKIHDLRAKYEGLWDQKKQATPIEQEKIMKKMKKTNKKLNKSIKVYDSLNLSYKVPVATNTSKNKIRPKPPIASKSTRERLQQKMIKNYQNKGKELIYAKLVFDRSKENHGLKPTFGDKTIYATLIHNQAKKQKENLSMHRKKEQVSGIVL